MSCARVHTASSMATARKNDEFICRIRGALSDAARAEFIVGNRPDQHPATKAWENTLACVDVRRRCRTSGLRQVEFVRILVSRKPIGRAPKFSGHNSLPVFVEKVYGSFPRDTGRSTNHLSCCLEIYKNNMRHHVFDVGRVTPYAVFR